MKNLILLSVFIYLDVQISFAQPGTPDPGFGINGVVKTDIGKHFGHFKIYSSGFKVLLANDGSIYNVVGASGETFITKRHANGSADSSYGTDGFSVVVAIIGSDAIMQPDGKIIIVGTTGGDYYTSFALARYNTNGSLDYSFGHNGMETNYFGVVYSSANAVALQDDGKIVVGGSSQGFMLVRYNVDGSLDNSFSAEGNHTTSYGVDVATSVHILKDGKIVVAGIKSNSANANFGVVRYNNDGSLDHTFGDDGRQITSFGNNNAYAYSSVIEDDGKIIVAGLVQINVFPRSNMLAIARYTPDGHPDTTFDNDGKITTNSSINFYFDAPSITLQRNQKIVLAATNGEFVVLRFNSNGSPDTTFSGDGKQTTGFNNTISIAKAVAIQTDGKIIAAGEANVPPGASSNFGLIRYNIDGSPDSNFGKNGIIQGGVLQGNTVYKSTAVQKDGKVVAAGYTWNGEKFIFAVSRFNLNGTPDSSFSGDGTKTTSFDKGDDMGSSVAIQADGKIVVGGSTSKGKNHDFAFARYTTGGEPDSTFSSDGKQEVSFGTAGNDYANAIAIQADGKIMAVGESKKTAALVRLTTNGSLDSTFAGDGRQTISYGNIATAVALQSDGKIVISGDFYPFALARFTSNGYLDKTFGYGGLATANFKYDYDAINAVAIQGDGKIIAAANINYLEEANTFVVARYTAAGGMDNSFGDHGRAMFDSYDAYVNSLAIENDGKILAGGVQNNHSSVTRITVNGSIDSSFGINGTRVVQISGAEDDIYNIAVENNSLYAAGTCQCPGNLGTVIKYMLNGNDTTPLVNRVPGEINPVSRATTDQRSTQETGGFKLRLLPNPAHSILTIHTTGLAVDKTATISTISSSGVILQTKQLNNPMAIGLTPTIQLDVSTLKSGIYILKIISGSKVVYKQFVKM